MKTLLSIAAVVGGIYWVSYSATRDPVEWYHIANGCTAGVMIYAGLMLFITDQINKHS